MKPKKKIQRVKSIQVGTKSQRYLVDTSVIAQRKLFRLFKTKIKGELLIPNAVIAELENLANRGNDIGFKGLEEIAKLHKIKSRVKIKFLGDRPNQHQIKFAKSGEIDALIRNQAVKEKAILIYTKIIFVVKIVKIAIKKTGKH